MASQFELAYETIKKRILNGEYKPAQSLVETNLAADLKVSRNTVTKALFRLAMEQLVIIEPNKSTIVRFFSLNEAVQYYELREELEGIIMRKTVPVMSDASIKKLAEILKEMQACIGRDDLYSYSENNLRFHQVIYDECPNVPSVTVVLSIKNQLRLYNVRTILIAGRSQQTFQEHKDIYEAIKKRDTDQAVHLIREHVGNIRAVIEKNFKLMQ